MELRSVRRSAVDLDSRDEDRESEMLVITTAGKTREGRPYRKYCTTTPNTLQACCSDLPRPAHRRWQPTELRRFTLEQGAMTSDTL